MFAKCHFATINRSFYDQCAHLDPRFGPIFAMYSHCLPREHVEQCHLHKNSLVLQRGSYAFFEGQQTTRMQIQRLGWPFFDKLALSGQWNITVISGFEIEAPLLVISRYASDYCRLIFGKFVKTIHWRFTPVIIRPVGFRQRRQFRLFRLHIALVSDGHAHFENPRVNYRWIQHMRISFQAGDCKAPHLSATHPIRPTCHRLLQQQS